MLKALIVDDEYLVRAGIHETIDWASYGVEIVGEASNGLEGLDLALSLLPDVVITDVRMPFMNGLEFLEKIREHRLPCGVIMLSGYDEFQYAQEALRHGASSYLLKPVNIDELVEEVLRIGRQTTQQAGDRLQLHKLQEEEHAITSQFWMDLFFGRITDVEVIKEKYDWLPIRLPSADTLLVAVIAIVPDTVVMDDFTATSKWTSVEQQIRLSASEHALSTVTTQRSATTEWTLIAELNLPAAGLGASLYAFGYSLIKEIREAAGFQVTIGFAQAADPYTGISAAFVKAREAAHKSISGLGGVLFETDDERSGSRREVRDALAYIRIHYADNVTADRVAEQVHVSATHLMHLFRKDLNKTFYECLTEYRIDEAKRLLRHSSYRVYEVGLHGSNDRSSSLLRQLKIRSRIVFVLIAGLSLHLTLMLGVFNIYAHTYLKNDLYNHIGNIQKEIGLSLELIVDDIQMLSLRFLVNPDIYRISGDSTLNEQEKKTRIRSLMEGIVAKNELVGDVVIITNEGTHYRYRSDKDIFEDPDAILISNIEQSTLPVIGKVKHDAEGRAYVVFGQKFRNFNTGQNIGIILLYVKESALYDLYKPAFEGMGYSYIASANNEVLSHPDKRIVGNTLLESDSFHPGNQSGYRNVKSNRQDYVLSTYPLSERLNRFGVHWKLVSVVSRPELFGAINEGNRNALYFALLAFIGLLALSFYLAAKITEPVFKLTKKLGSIGKSGLELVHERNQPKDEISELEHSYYTMIDRINKLISENNEEKEKQRIMELTALQSQINPHFLYNTLDAITWTARLKKQPEIERMISALATFFRISLHKGDKHIPVEEEIRLVQSFVTVELMRFPDKFEVTYDIPEPLRKIRILKLILQPLVENAIKHGMSEKLGKGLVEVKSWRTDENLYFEIKDDGVGFKSKSNVQSTDKNLLFQSGYGLRNVDERIKLEYGSESGLSITSEPGKGTTALIRIRLQKDQLS
ncbi:hypothetical protein AXX17_ATUG03420 [Arabidopsis thaliana]|uniref:Histidine kinase n=1 Tax=Arabidopsis thaliana TaxID=3702 RepID=A0A178U964_ARATH|nr:hypothetical protein AXX17_ATUG03420 [Arabidopsis thaliana]